MWVSSPCSRAGYGHSRKCGNEFQTNRRGEFQQIAVLDELAGLFVNAECCDGIAVLVADQQKLSRRINAEISRPVAARGFVADQTQLAGAFVNRIDNDAVMAAIRSVQEFSRWMHVNVRAVTCAAKSAGKAESVCSSVSLPLSSS